MYKVVWHVFIVAIWLAITVGLIWLLVRYREQNVGVSRVALIGIITINLFFLVGIYAVLNGF